MSRVNAIAAGVVTLGLLGLVASRYSPYATAPEPTPEPTSLLEGSSPADVRTGLRDPPKMPAEGLWKRARSPNAELEALEAIGYVQGSEAPTHPGGVTIHTPRASPGLNLYVSGHAPTALLMDMEGAELHRWTLDYDAIWPDRPADPRQPEHRFWRRAHLFPNGDLLAIFDGHGLIKLDRDSQLLWAWYGGAHHDLEVLPDGRIWVMSREGRRVPALGRHPIMVDYVSLLSPEGEELERIDLLDPILQGDMAPLYEASPKKRGDIFHTNSLQVLDGSAAHPAFAAGRLLLSSRRLNAIFVFDPVSRSIPWWRTGAFHAQHDPKVLPGGTLLLFDNWSSDRAHSVVREYDLPGMNEVWSYRGTEEAPFFSEFCGAAERLPNGNTLIVESMMGRVFEVTPDGEVVWTFHNPERAGEDGEFVAIVPDLIRVDPATLQFL